VSGTTPAPGSDSTPETESETQPAEKKKGCASAVQPGMLLLMIATLPVVTVRRKKEAE
jgi:hypothetical protein